MSRMTEDELTAFLAVPRVAVLGIARDNKGPLLAPMWVTITADRNFEFCMGGSTLKARRLRATGRATLCLHGDDFPYRYVLVEGPVTMRELGDETRPRIQALATQYLGERGGRKYAEQFATPDEILVTLTAERLTAEIPGSGAAQPAASDA